MSEKNKKEIPERIKKFASDKKILRILKNENSKFAEENLSDYIYLSNIVPQEPIEEDIICDRVTIVASVESFIIGRSVSFQGFCINGGNSVRLIIFGPGEYSNGVEVAAPKINPTTNMWKYQWSPDFSLLPGTYIATVYDSKKRVYDEVPVMAEKGAVTIAVMGDQMYSIGEKIKFSGTSTASNMVYLLLAGHPFEKEGRKLDQLSIIPKNNDPTSFVSIRVASDNTWSYVWDTSIVGGQLEPGMYTVFAVEGPFTRDQFSEKAFGSVSILIKKPFISATCSQSTVAKGDRLIITGTTTGSQYHKVQIWIFGESFFHLDIINTDYENTFTYDFTRLVKEKLVAGQYYVIIQHPMMNNEFDVYLDENKEKIFSNSPNTGTYLFSLVGPERISGFNAAKALLTALNNPKIDDIHTRMQFLVENPVIKIDSIGDKHSGDRFTITAITNLAVDDEILFQVSQLKNQSKRNFGEFFGATGIVKVMKGDAGLNSVSIDIDTTGWESDEYIVKLDAMLQNVTSESIFNLI